MGIDKTVLWRIWDAIENFFGIIVLPFIVGTLAFAAVGAALYFGTIYVVKPLMGLGKYLHLGFLLHILPWVVLVFMVYFCGLYVLCEFVFPFIDKKKGD